MKALLLTLLFQGPPLTGCSDVWYVRLTFERAPLEWETLAVGVEDYRSREAAQVLRDDILAHGWVEPWLTPHDPDGGELRVAPGAIRYASVKRICCRMDLPPQERPACTYPDGDPPEGQ